jgi:hypothetical protein
VLRDAEDAAADEVIEVDEEVEEALELEVVLASAIVEECDERGLEMISRRAKTSEEARAMKRREKKSVNQ